MTFDPYFNANANEITLASIRDWQKIKMDRRRLEMQEGLYPLQRRMLINELRQEPAKMSMLNEQKKQLQIESISKMLNLISMFSARGYTKEQSWPIIQKIMPKEFINVDAKDITIQNTGTGNVRVIYENPSTRDSIISYIDENDGEVKYEKFSGYKASIPDLAHRATLGGKEGKSAKQALEMATRPQFITDEEGNVLAVNPRGGMTDTGIKKRPLIPASQVNEMAILQTTLDDIANVEKYSAWKYAGMIKGRVGANKEKTGIAVNEQEQNARTAVATLKKNLFDIGGKVLTGNELKILEPYIPEMTDPEPVFKIRLENFKREYNLILKNKQNKFTQYGYKPEREISQIRESRKEEIPTNDYSLDELPDPSQYKGKKAESENGELYISDGTTWHKIK